MSQDFVIEAFPRDDQGRGASRRLRREERKIPAIIYGGHKDATPIAIWHNELKKALENEAFYSRVLTIELNGEKESVILKDLQRHPYKPLLSHADFQRVNKDEEIFVHVPLHLVNEESAPAIKTFGGVAFRLMTQVEVACLPEKLPEFIEIDLFDVEMDGIVHMSDLKLPEGVRIPALQHGAEHDQAVVTINKPKGVKSDTVEDEEEGEDKQ
ncbi:50S ribosomal protein L25/general stress protein Ctc [Marinobacter sp. M3C]|jgi:large subunit ribosomal protein L25|uniref:50S ribosomal protein L25/general stress protein Ctc n=1 Tax=unclassified Marinobacter TaxID=83889 RepID=UPI0020107E66|nr:MULTISPECIES: 50S ribosomal protein L25/general stress protein Ctc [unclassified Marinobacter]MCL1478053.1 50S ribosomal protein L25/general stress protein Ctc [Marinobacter sp.]MCL1482280.1 50S ribosomal protein L25/general stress protein Ctc [Marinobacter sp.]MCL1485324.1 50S ribosomal protein L25/general stress protein Ctc [Marinobacter sp.]MCL1486531.1 50S ribosomal protein L25/general stress protein Ctc [Marinobacter sp.]UQG56972.1 50S ribosomal protein L25/general stress protein Ctc [